MKILALFIFLFSLFTSDGMASSTLPPASGKSGNVKRLNRLQHLSRMQQQYGMTTAPYAVSRKQGFKAMLLSHLLKWKMVKKLIGPGEPTERQRKQGKWSFILGLAAILILVIPFGAIGLPAAIGVLTFPLAISGIVLGLKSTQGNSNTIGLIGLILSASYLLLLLLSIVFLFIFFASGWN